MPQDGAALNNLTVEEALFFTAFLRGMNKNEAKKEKDFLLSFWDINDLKNKPAVWLSGGQKRLLQLAVSMANNPPVLILDEPTNDLDPQRRKQVWNNLKELNDTKGTTIIFITHDAIEAEKAVQRVGIIAKGELIALGDPVSLKQQINEQLRLELFFKKHSPPKLPIGLTYHEIVSGHWVVFLEKSDVGTALSQIEMSKVDDLKLYSTTLEDLFIHYAGT